MGGKAASSSSNQTTTSTVNVVDSYKSSINRVSNLSDVGNVTLSIGDESDTDGLTRALPVLGFVGVALLLVPFLFKRKG